MNSEEIVLGGGCFWCLDASYRLVNGVMEVISGYTGGHTLHPNYQDVSSGNTGHAEVVKIVFDTSILSLEDILEIFWAIHDPTTLNRQGNDVGTQYRSAVFYSNGKQKEIAENSVQKTQKLWNDPVVTEIQPLVAFYPAEDYHQNYFAKNPNQAYCQVVINPKLAKLRESFASKLK